MDIYAELLYIHGWTHEQAFDFMYSLPGAQLNYDEFLYNQNMAAWAEYHYDQSVNNYYNRAAGVANAPTSANNRNIILNIVGKIWTAPNTAIGLIWGGVGYAAGLLPGVSMPTISFGNNAIQFENHPLMKFGAIAFGNAISYAKDYGPNRTGDSYGRKTNNGLHEKGHTYQYQLLGPLFLPIYFSSGGISARNPWEQAADNFALG